MFKLLLSLVVFALPAFAETPPIDVFAEVAPGIFRGARPGTAGVEYLAKMGVKTILNIDDDEAAIDEEAADAARLGIKMISIPLSGFWAPSDEDVDAILNTLRDSTQYPIFLHCQHGQDRTGMIVGLYRIFFEEVKPETAYQEALDFGFHRELIFLDHYFRDRAGID